MPIKASNTRVSKDASRKVQSAPRNEFRLITQPRSPYLNVRVMVVGKRRLFSTGETSKKPAMSKARAILADIRSRGFDEAIRLHAKKKPEPLVTDPTLKELGELYESNLLQQASGAGSLAIDTEACCQALQSALSQLNSTRNGHDLGGASRIFNALERNNLIVLMFGGKGPRESPDRLEIVALMLEDHSRKATSMLPILRDEVGNFTEFGDPGPMLVGDPVGRFAGLMPRNKPSAREAAQTKATLLALGMNIVNRGFDPTMN